MYGLDELKEKLEVTESWVSCPVRGCQRQVERQRRVFRREGTFFCDDHQIYISPTTFEYEKEEENILWDFALLQEHMASKRESRIARDNSEDAVTWNVFRFLEGHNLLLPYLSSLSGSSLRETKAIYWSHDPETGKPWKSLWESRETFGENPHRGSEPDLIILTDRMLCFIEAKLTASNETRPSRPDNPKQYVSGGGGWWNHVFVPSADYRQLAEQEQKYELLRFWLLGTWIAKQHDRTFMLFNLVRDAAEKDIEARFRRWLPAEMACQFRRLSWESILHFIRSHSPEGCEKQRIIRYFATKTVGYQKTRDEWHIQRAFSA